MNDLEKWVLFRNKFRLTGFVIAPIIFTIILNFPIEELTFEAKLVLGLAAWMAIWWGTETIPFYVTASIPFFVFPILDVA